MRKNTASYNLQKRQIGFQGKYKPRPFWLPASSFYILAAAGAIACFFFLWWILREGGEEVPYIPAGIGASLVLVGAVFLREVILRKARLRYLQAQKMLDYNINKVGNFSARPDQRNKLSIEQNASIVDEIKKKSEAALILEKFSDGHWEVFDLCNSYLHRNKNELQTVGVGSPRLAAFRRSREIVKEIHRRHLLVWAELESRANLKNAQNQIALSDRLVFTQKALSILDTALEFYPGEAQLRDSVEAVKEFNSSVKLSHLIESAEKAAFKGDEPEALNLYRDALFFLQKDEFQSPERRLIEENIVAEIEKIEQNHLIKD